MQDQVCHIRNFRKPHLLNTKIQPNDIRVATDPALCKKCHNCLLFLDFSWGPLQALLWGSTFRKRLSSFRQSGTDCCILLQKVPALILSTETPSQASAAQHHSGACKMQSFPEILEHLFWNSCPTFTLSLYQSYLWNKIFWENSEFPVL